MLLHHATRSNCNPPHIRLCDVTSFSVRYTRTHTHTHTLNVSCYWAQRSSVVYFPMMLSAMWLTPLRGEGNQPLHLQRRGRVEVLTLYSLRLSSESRSGASWRPVLLSLNFFFQFAWSSSLSRFSSNTKLTASSLSGFRKCLRPGMRKVRPSLLSALHSSQSKDAS